MLWIGRTTHMHFLLDTAMFSAYTRFSLFFCFFWLLLLLLYFAIYAPPNLTATLHTSSRRYDIQRRDGAIRYNNVWYGRCPSQTILKLKLSWRSQWKFRILFTVKLNYEPKSGQVNEYMNATNRPNRPNGPNEIQWQRMARNGNTNEGGRKMNEIAQANSTLTEFRRKTTRNRKTMWCWNESSSFSFRFLDEMLT